LQFQTRNALLAHRSGVTYGTSFIESAVIAGLSTTFRTGAAHALEKGAVVQEVSALHVGIGRLLNPLILRTGSPAGVSQEIAGLRRLLFGFESQDTETGYWFKKASQGLIPLVIEVENADIMATLLKLKAEVENRRGTVMKMVFAGAAEAHLLAPEIAKAKVGVILRPARPFPFTWDSRRILAGPPLTEETSVTTLVKHGVIVALGINEMQFAVNVRFDMSWAMVTSGGKLSREQAYALSSSNLEKLLGVDIGEDGDLVAFEGGDAFGFSSKAKAIISPQRKMVEVL